MGGGGRVSVYLKKMELLGRTYCGEGYHRCDDDVCVRRFVHVMREVSEYT